MSNKQSKPVKRLSGLIGMAAAVAVGGAGGFLAASVLDRAAGDNTGLFFLYLFILILSFFAACLVQIVIHESGHLICGLMSGYRFVSFNILGFIWQKGPDGKLRMGRMQIAGAGGQCLMAPPEYGGGSFPFTLYNLGGVVMNLLTSALFALAAWLIPVVPLQILLTALAVVGVFFALINGLPIPVAAIQNDGKNLLCIRRDADARRAFWVQMALAAELAEGTRIKDMPDEWFAAFPEEKLDNPIVSAVAVMNTSRLMDMLDFDGAEREIRRLLAREKGILGLYRMSMGCDGAVCELIAGRPAELTTSLQTAENRQMMAAMKNYPAVLRTEYAIALLRDRDGDKAGKLLEAFEASARTHPNPQEILGERELILAIQNALLNREAQA